jgi:hypothetical protein
MSSVNTSTANDGREDRTVFIVIPLKEALEAIDEIAARTDDPAAKAALAEAREAIDNCTQFPACD